TPKGLRDYAEFDERIRRSTRIVEDQAEGRPASSPYPAHAVAHRDTMEASRPAPRPLLDRDDRRCPLKQRHHDRTRLHARTLLHENQLASVELRARLAQQHDDLQRKVDRPVEVLM